MTLRNASRTISRIFLMGKAPRRYLGSQRRHLVVGAYDAPTNAQMSARDERLISAAPAGAATTTVSRVDTGDKEVAGWDGT